MAEPADRVFVYGTLLKGQSNHGCLRGARLLGRHRTEAVYTLLHLGAYPGVVTGGETSVSGEVYAIDPVLLRRLDRLEDYPHEYDRRRIDTPYGAAWIYLYRHPRPGQARIPHGDWRRR